MSTVADILQSLKRECGDYPADPVLALDWLKGRYAEVLERVPFSFLVKESNFTTTLSVSAGTVTVTGASSTVTESVSNANGWSSSLIGRYFRRRGDNEFYAITSYGNDNPDTITLERNYEGDTSTLNEYDIWQRYYSLASDARSVVSMFMGRDHSQPLLEISQTDLDIGFPNRPVLNSPSYWAMAGRDSSNLIRIELYPIPFEYNSIHYRYIQSTPDLSDGSITILPQLPTGLLRAGWLCDYWRWRAAYKNAADWCLITADRYEAEFQKKLQELVARECLALSPKRVRFSGRMVQHRGYQKFGRGGGNITLPD